MDLFAHWSEDCLQTSRALGHKCKITRKQRRASPFPKGKVFVICSILLADHFGALMIFPFLPFMVRDFFPELSKEELGSKTGYLASAYYCGNFVGSIFWGWLSDKWGRRPVLILGISGSIFSMLLFGFSQNFSWAVSARFLWGLLNGNLGVAKTYLSEVCDDSNMAQGFAVVGVSASIGRLLGSSLGGFLAQPASKYSAFQVPFFCQFPYITPCFLVAGYAVIILIAACLFLEETHHKGRFKKQGSTSHTHQELTNQNAESNDTDSDVTDVEMMSLSSDVSDSVSVEAELLTNQVAESDVDCESDSTVIPGSDTELLLKTGDVDVGHRRGHGWIKGQIVELRAISPGSCMRRFFHHQQQQCLECCWCCIKTPEESLAQNERCSDFCWNPVLTMRRIASRILASARCTISLLKDRRILFTIFLYSSLGSAGTICNEIFPLLMVTDHQHGGYSMDDNEIGVVISSIAVVQLIFQLIAYPRIVKLLGYRWTFRLFLIFFAASCIFIPFSNTITGPIVTNQSNSTTGWSGSGWAGSGLNSTDYCGLDTAGSEGAVNEDSVKRIPPLVWLVVTGGLMALMLSRVVSMTSSMVMVNNSTLPETRGTVNGVSQSMVAILRSIGPALAANLFSWSELNTDNGASWPLNYHFMYDVVAAVILINLCVSFFLPKTIEKKRDTQQ